jgi:hypothetical protein
MAPKRYRLAARSFPRRWRRVHSTELLATLRERDETKGGPSWREAVALVRGGLMVRLRGRGPLRASALMLGTAAVLPEAHWASWALDGGYGMSADFPDGPESAWRSVLAGLAFCAAFGRRAWLPAALLPAAILLGIRLLDETAPLTSSTLLSDLEEAVLGAVVFGSVAWRCGRRGLPRHEATLPLTILFVLVMTMTHAGAADAPFIPSLGLGSWLAATAFVLTAAHAGANRSVPRPFAKRQ